MFSPQPQEPVKLYPAAAIRSPGSEPLAPVWLKGSLSIIHWLWPRAPSVRLGLTASGCLGAVEIVSLDGTPSFRAMPNRDASPAGADRARLISSIMYCSRSLGATAESSRRDSRRSGRVPGRGRGRDDVRA